MSTTLPPAKLLHLLLSVLAFVWGACVGSFLNVCIHRIPREQSVIKPRSRCPHCGHPIPWHRNIPLLSYVLLRGRCHDCGGRISPRYVLVELLVGVLFLLAWLKFDPEPGTRPLHLVPVSHWPLVPIYWLVMAGLALGTFVDFEHLIIPDRVTLGGILAGLALSAAVPALHGAGTLREALWQSALGAAVGWALLWSVGILGTAVFRKEAMGFGDVKLLGAIGAFFGWKAVLFTVVLSSFFGAVVGLTLVLGGRKEMQSRIPFGPYLALAAVIWIAWGPALLQAYLSLMTPSLR
jgi:leader peptidase (prepilin peptidase)/N-methyltransferase